MKYYKHNSIPLEEEFPGIGEASFDEYGNYVEINVFNEGSIIVNTVLTDGFFISDYIYIDNIGDEQFLKTFWILTNKKINKEDEIYNTIEEDS